MLEWGDSVSFTRHWTARDEIEETMYKSKELDGYFAVPKVTMYRLAWRSKRATSVSGCGKLFADEKTLAAWGADANKRHPDIHHWVEAVEVDANANA